MSISNIVALFVAVTIVHLFFTAWLSFFQKKLPLEVALVSFLVGLGLLGYLAFWAYYLHRALGIMVSAASFLLALQAFGTAWQHRQWRSLWISHQLLLPVSAYAFFILFIGCFSCLNFESISSVASTRWIDLPSDNLIPKCFADQCWHGKISTPMSGDWLSSDRPPLQTGLYLLLYPLRLDGWRDGLFYQTISSMLQALCLLPVFLLVKTIKPHLKILPRIFQTAVPQRALEQDRYGLPGLTLIALGMTSLMALHTLFVWPKLMATTYVLIFYLMIMTSFGKNISCNNKLVAKLAVSDAVPGASSAERRSLLNTLESASSGATQQCATTVELCMRFFLPAAAAALAMLSHGGAFFALLPIALLYGIRFRFSGIVAAVPTGILSLLLFAPWLLYQRLIDPPGDRLIKWHLAGAISPDPHTPLIQAILRAYSTLTPAAWLDGRRENWKKIVGGTPDFFHHFWNLCLHPLPLFRGNAHPDIVVRSFFDTFYSLWWFSPLIALALWLALRGWRKGYSPDFAWLGITAIVSLFIWSLLMFIPGSTTLHQGSFFPWIALFVIATILFWSASRASFFLALGLNGLLFFHCYVLDYVWKNISEKNVLYLLFSTTAFFIFVKSCLALQKIFLPSPSTPLNH